MDKLHNAEASLELCRAILAQHGQNNAAETLRGLELPTVESAKLALGLIRDLKVYGPAAGAAKHFALQTLQNALSVEDIAEA